MNPPPYLFDPTSFVPGSRICVAVSGGADSVSLLCSLAEACRADRTPLGIGLTAVHVNHGLRNQEGELDQAFVQDLCARLDIPLQIHHVDVTTFRQTTKASMEEAARILRYRVFKALLAETSVDDLLTAHTRDDQAETVLMKFLRGAWTEGLGGIHPVIHSSKVPGKRILRPMLGTSRAEILEYLTKQGQAWREDSTNRDLEHTRNRIRHQILPLLRTENPGLDQTLANLAEIARDEEEHWEKDLSRLLPQVLLPGNPVRGGGRAVSTKAGTSSVAVEVERLRGLDQATRRRVLRAAVRSLQPVHAPASGCIRLSFGETTRLLAMCGLGHDVTVSSRPGASLSLTQNLTAKRSARELTLILTSP